MNWIELIMAGILCFIGAWSGTEAVRAYALRKNLMDQPNERSSHSVPTARGGGVAVIATILLAAFVLRASDSAWSGVIGSLVPSLAAVAAVGWLDDRIGLPAYTRLVVHFLSAAWFLAFAFDPLAAFGVEGRAAWIATYCVAAVLIVWALNLYNFMDGIDGLAGSEGVFLGAAGAFLFWRHGLYVPATLMVLTACATFGFLVHNWPPARIFMGDAGSGGMGFLLAAVPVANLGAEGPSVYVWAILWGTFLCDATTTLARRVLRGERLAQAHRGHAYQVLSRRVGSHRTVTQWYTVVNLVWLLPLAIVADSSAQIGRWACVIALLPLCIAAWIIGSGPDLRER